DLLQILFNEPMLLGSNLPSDPVDIVSVTNGSLAGATFRPRQPNEDYKLVTIVLGAGSSLSLGSSEIELVGSGAIPLVDSETLIDLLGNPAYANELSTVMVVEGFGTSSNLSPDTTPIWIDIMDTAEGVSEGD